MRFSEIITENTDEIEDVVQDICVRLMTNDFKKIDTTEFLHKVAQEGYVIPKDELIAILGSQKMQGFVSQVGSDEIVFSNSMGDVEEPEASVDVGAMAQNQAMDDIKADL